MSLIHNISGACEGWDLAWPYEVSDVVDYFARDSVTNTRLDEEDGDIGDYDAEFEDEEGDTDDDYADAECGRDDNAPTKDEIECVIDDFRGDNGKVPDDDVHEEQDDYYYPEETGDDGDDDGECYGEYYDPYCMD